MEKYVKQYEIRSYECTMDKSLRLQTLFNLFQDMADTHANLMGIGYDYCVLNNLFWVGSNYVVEIERMPEWGETIEIRTWPSEKSLVCGIRDFEILDKNGEKIIGASSRWALLDKNRMRPVSIEKFAKHEPLLEHSISTNFPKICDFDEWNSEKMFDVNFSDIDVNRHVNNSVYPLWAENSIALEYKMTHKITKISVAFKKSAHFSDKIKVLTNFEGNTSKQKIVSADNAKDFAHIETEWKELPQI